MGSPEPGRVEAMGVFIAEKTELPGVLAVAESLLRSSLTQASSISWDARSAMDAVTTSAV
jgi:hypothetical protein